ncbi:unknown [Firmicutes bacterium CAG:791]|nr:unknown [Firmicutes bacterium CAG:791]
MQDPALYRHHLRDIFRPPHHKMPYPTEKYPNASDCNSEAAPHRFRPYRCSRRYGKTGFCKDKNGHRFRPDPEWSPQGPLRWQHRSFRGHSSQAALLLSYCNRSQRAFWNSCSYRSENRPSSPQTKSRPERPSQKPASEPWPFLSKVPPFSVVLFCDQSS